MTRDGRATGISFSPVRRGRAEGAAAAPAAAQRDPPPPQPHRRDVAQGVEQAELLHAVQRQEAVLDVLHVSRFAGVEERYLAVALIHTDGEDVLAARGA